MILFEETEAGALPNDSINRFQIKTSTRRIFSASTRGRTHSRALLSTLGLAGAQAGLLEPAYVHLYKLKAQLCGLVVNTYLFVSVRYLVQFPKKPSFFLFFI